MADRERVDANKVRDDAARANMVSEAERARETRENACEKTPRKRGGFSFWKLRLVLIAALLVAVIVAALILVPRIKKALTPDFTISLPDSISELLPDEKMGYSRIDFAQAILGETREKAAFVVLEQDVQVTSRISQTMANIALFAKTKVIHSYGTGVYTLDLSKLSDADIALDASARCVIVTVPHAMLSYVEIDVEKTEFEDTEKAIFAFGEIKLTPEQLNMLEQSIDAAMREHLDTPVMLEKADEAALKQTRALFLPLVQALSGEYTVKVVMGD